MTAAAAADGGDDEDADQTRDGQPAFCIHQNTVRHYRQKPLANLRRAHTSINMPVLFRGKTATQLQIRPHHIESILLPQLLMNSSKLLLYGGE